MSAPAAATSLTTPLGFHTTVGIRHRARQVGRGARAHGNQAS